MKLRLKPIEDQVIIITGATSGIGLVTARMAAQRGARLVLAARNAEALSRLEDELGPDRVLGVVADVGEESQVKAIAQAAIANFGGFDTWVNNAGVSIYGRLLDVSLDDQRRLFDTNYWGVVHGSLEAARYLHDRGGAIINVGSVLSDRAIPLQGAYCASKFAVKAFTDALRMELEKERAPISLTLIKPGAIDTPYESHAKNYLLFQPRNTPPAYAPETVAKAILHAAQHPVRDLFVGGSAPVLSTLGAVAPRLTDRWMEATMFRGQQTRTPDTDTQHSLYLPSGDLDERGSRSPVVFERSLYTQAAMHPVTTGLALGAGAIAIAALFSNRRQAA